MRLVSDDALAAITIWQESRGEPFEGKVAVGEVIRARMARRYMSDGTVAGTVARDRQFSGWNHNDPNRIPSLRIDDTDAEVKACVQAWHESARTQHALGAVHYLNVEATKRGRLDGTLPAWAADPDDPARVNERRVLAVIGRHHFLRD